jgi:hypothetical protein
MIDGVRDPLLPLVEEAITIPTRSTGPRATVPRSCCHCRRRCSHSRSHHRCHSRCSHCRCCRIVVAVVASSWLSTHRAIVVRHPPDLHHSHRGVASSNTASPICIIATIHETTRVEPNENEDKVVGGDSRRVRDTSRRCAAMALHPSHCRGSSPPAASRRCCALLLLLGSLALARSSGVLGVAALRKKKQEHLNKTEENKST